MPLFDFGGPQSGLSDVKIAVNNGDGTFGAMVDVPSVQLLDVQLQISSKDLEGDDRITASSARITKAQIQTRWGSIHMDVLDVMLNGGAGVIDDYGPYTSRRINITNKKLLEFGICGKANAEKGGGDTHLFAPLCKVGSNFSLKFEYDSFSIPEVTLNAVADDNFLDDDGNAICIIPIEYETARPVALPPV